MKTIPTQPFKHNYKVVDTIANEILLESHDIEEIYHVYDHFVHRLSYWFFFDLASDRVDYPTHDIGHDLGFKYKVHHQFLIMNHFWEPISKEMVLELHDRYSKQTQRYRRWMRHRNDFRSTIVIRYKKNDPNKIKPGHNYAYDWENDDWTRQGDFVIGGCHRSFSHHMSERRQNAAHCDEYGPQIVRGRRRGRNLPDPWDDYPNTSWDTGKSWKHNSRRQRQWKVKGLG
jgi:hypothetical protein